MRGSGRSLAARLASLARPSSRDFGSLPRAALALDGQAARDATQPEQAAEGAAGPQGAQAVPGAQQATGGGGGATSRRRGPTPEELLARERLVASFAAQLGLPVEGANPEAVEAARAEAAAVLAASAGWAPRSAPASRPRAAEPERANKGGRKEETPISLATADDLYGNREKKWQRAPPEYPSYEVFDSWLHEHEQDLAPLRRYLFEELGMEPEAAISELFRLGRPAWGLMMSEWQSALVWPDDEGEEPARKKKAAAKKSREKKKKKGEAEPDEAAEGEAQLATAAEQGEASALGQEGEGQQQQAQHAQRGPPPRPRLAEVVEEWRRVLGQLGLEELQPLGQLAARWPALLVERPPGGREELAARLGKLRQLFSFDQRDLAHMVNAAPQILFTTVNDATKRLAFLKLHAHVGDRDSDVAGVLRVAPELLWAQEGRLMENIRVLVEYCPSAGSYANLVRWNPKLLLMASRGRLESTLRKLRTLLPAHLDAKEVLRARPQLLLQSRDMRRNWLTLREACAELPTWQEELDALLQRVPEQTQQQQQAGEPAGRQPAAKAARGRKQAAAGAAAAAAADSAAGSAPSVAPPTVLVNFEQRGPVRLSQKDREQYYALGRLLDARSDQLDRLRFLLEVHPGAAADGAEPLAELLTMRPRTFERNFPGFGDWLAAREGSTVDGREQAAAAAAAARWQRAIDAPDAVRAEAAALAPDAWGAVGRSEDGDESSLPRRRSRSSAEAEDGGRQRRGQRSSSRRAAGASASEGPGADAEGPPGQSEARPSGGSSSSDSPPTQGAAAGSGPQRAEQHAHDDVSGWWDARRAEDAGK